MAFSSVIKPLMKASKAFIKLCKRMMKSLKVYGDLSCL